MKKLTLETTAPFQGLAELVADKEGFRKEFLRFLIFRAFIYFL